MDAKPTRCPSCQSEDLVHGTLEAPSFKFNFWKGVGMQAAACLVCGTVTPYLDTAALNTLAEWHAAAHPRKETSDEL
jgi:hypothetical protein